MALDAQEMEVLTGMIQRILIIQTSFIGDSILTLPLIQQLKEVNTEAEIDVITIPKCKEIFEASPYVSSVIIYDKRGKERSIGKTFKLAREVSKKRYEKVICLHRSLRSAILSSAIKAREKSGYDTSALPYVFDKLVEYNFSWHEVRRNLSFTGKRYNDEEWRINPVVKSVSIDDKLKNLPATELKIAIAPGSAWGTKEYPIQHFIKVMELLNRKETGFVIIGDAKGFAKGEKIISNLAEKGANFCGKLSITETIELLRRCDLLITNDSAPTHFGIAAGIKVLTIYTSTIPEFGFYPYNCGSEFIGLGGLECRPCGIHGFKECPKGHFKCGEELAPEVIYNRIMGMILEKKKY